MSFDADAHWGLRYQRAHQDLGHALDGLTALEHLRRHCHELGIYSTRLAELGIMLETKRANAKLAIHRLKQERNTDND